MNLILLENVEEVFQHAQRNNRHVWINCHERVNEVKTLNNEDLYNEEKTYLSSMGIVNCLGGYKHIYILEFLFFKLDSSLCLTQCSVDVGTDETINIIH